MRILVTGGCGFIGSNFILNHINHSDVEFIVNVDLMTYASNTTNVEGVMYSRKYSQYLGVDIGSKKEIEDILRMFEIDTVVNFAAETHVDNSIKDPSIFIKTNVLGTFNLLNSCKSVWSNNFYGKRFVHISTDEVYGTLTDILSEFSLDTPYKPNSPYAASKASSDLICRSFNKTYNFPVIVTNCCNNYGPRQHVEKLIPLTISRLKNRKHIPVYGTGKNIREWIYVDDHCDAIWNVLKGGKLGEQYLIGSGYEVTNIELVQVICDLFDELTGEKNSRELITFVTDRAGHDFRYSIDSSKIQTEMNWNTKTSFKDGIRRTIQHYLS